MCVLACVQSCILEVGQCGSWQFGDTRHWIYMQVHLYNGVLNNLGKHSTSQADCAYVPLCDCSWKTWVTPCRRKD